MKRKVLAAAIALLGVAAGAVLWATHRPAASAPNASNLDAAVTLADHGFLVHDVDSNHLALVTPDGTRRQTDRTCLRISAARTRAVCLAPDPAVRGQFVANILDEHLKTLRTVALHGIPSRTRISPDGRMVAWTTFFTGDSYASDSYSTRSGILDLETGRETQDLEGFRVDGGTAAVDANFWGVTFAADDNTFYATMLTRGHYYLVRGDFSAASVTTITDGVECPSLSPDGTRVVYKKRLPNRGWQLWVLDLATEHRTKLAVPRSVDDQAVWLDNDTVAFAMADADDRLSVYSVPADGSGTATQIVRRAESPAPLG